MNYQTNSGHQCLKLIQEVPTRWNSTCYMMHRFLELENAIKGTIAILNANLPLLTLEEWNLCRELLIVLQAFEKATKTVSTEQYSSASLIIPLICGLVNVCNKLSRKTFTNCTKTVIEKL